MLTGLLLSAAAAAAPIAYVLEVDRGGGVPRVTVTMKFDGDPDGETEVTLPTKWAGSTELWRAIGPPAVSGGTLRA